MRTVQARRAFFLASVSMAAVALAQGANAQAPATDSSVGEVVVTASRVARTGFTAPTPTTVIGEDQIEARGATNVTEVLNEAPAFRPSQTPAASARGGSTNSGSFLDLRGLNGQGGTATARTLVLVDGRRHVPSTTAGQVDINMIPSQLIERTEVVTGGASAAWGSDAIAGVVNMILKDRLQGLEGSVAYGQAEEGDYEEYSAALAGGTSFAGGRGHVIAGVEYVDNNGVGDGFFTRDWGRPNYGSVALAATRPAGLPARVLGRDIRVSDRMAPGGVIVGGPLDNIEFTGGQGTRTLTTGALVGGNQMLGGGAADSNAGINLGGGSNLVNPVERWSSLGRVSFDFTPNVTAFVEYSHAESKVRGFSAQRRDDGSLTIQRDNALLPESVRTQMVTRGLTTITVGRIAMDSNYSNYTTATDQKTDRVVLGLRGKVLGDWSWDAYYQKGVNNFIQNNQSTINTNYTAAIDVVRNAAGQLICRPGPALTAADPGCVPFNIFGQNSPSQEAINYVRGVGVNDVTTEQDVAAINLSGDPINFPAGPVSVAVGFEYRKEQGRSEVDANSFNRRFDLNNFQPLKGEYSTKEVYGEVVIPLLRDINLAHRLDFNGAVRHTDYSTSGPVTTWKLGGSWEPIEELRFRVTQSRDIRAPNISELFAGALQTRGGVVNPFTGTSVQHNIITSGNPDLTPEVADTFTAGVVYQPRWLSGFRASIDAYDIEIEDVITQFTPQLVIDRCFAGVQSLCQDITFGPGQVVTELRNRRLNFNSLATSGVDFEFSYNVPPEFLGIPGRFNLRALGNYVEKLVITDPTGPIDRVTETVPKWAWNFQVGYNLERLSLNAQVRYIDAMVGDVTLVGPGQLGYNPALANSTSDNSRPSVMYLNLSAQYRLIDRDGMQLQLFGVLNNVFDENPPQGSGSNVTTASLYDLIGRSGRVGVRFKY